MSSKRDVLQGTLDLMVLQVLAREPMHGWGVAKRIEQRSGDVLQVNQGSIYPALYRLADRGWVRSRLGESDEGRPVKIYELTAAGKRQLAEERESWTALSRAVNLVLDMGS